MELVKIGAKLCLGFLMSAFLFTDLALAETKNPELKRAGINSSLEFSPEKLEKFAIGLLRQRKILHRNFLNALLDPAAKDGELNDAIEALVSVNSLLNDVRRRANLSGQPALASKVYLDQQKYLGKLKHWEKDLEKSSSLGDSLGGLISKISLKK